MSHEKFENFLFIPGHTNPSLGTIYELEECKEFIAPGFVLLPYYNPKIQPSAPIYFKVSSRHEDELIDHASKFSSTKLHLHARTSKESYLDKIKQLKGEIQKGNVYELNFCIEFFNESAVIDPIAVFNRLHSLSKAPYACLVKLGDNYIISASPELFLKKTGNILSSKPIKGTIRRGKSLQEDEVLKDSLYNNIKERTENVMAVDVARNDLSILATRGTVCVNKLYNIETFETVHQMVSTVSCELKSDTSFEGIINSTFPMASMTGAPKISAMNLIDKFEDSKRNFYSGAMGLCDENGDFELSVIIRSIFYNTNAKRVSINVGSAITYLSSPEEEYEECLLKAKALLTALGAQLH